MVRVVSAVVVVTACVVWVTVSVTSSFAEEADDEDEAEDLTEVDEDDDLTEVIFVEEEDVIVVDETSS